MAEIDKSEEAGKPVKKGKSHYFKLGLTIFLTVAACILFFFVIFRMENILNYIGKILKAGEPIIIGLMLAYLLMPVKNFVEKPTYKWLQKRGVKEEKSKKLARGIGIAGTVVFLLALIVMFIAILAPALTNSVSVLGAKMPKYVETFTEWIQESKVGDSSFSYYVAEVITTAATAVEDWIVNSVLPEAQQYIAQITSGVLSVVKALLNFIIGIIVMVYVMAIQETLLGQTKKIIYAVFPAKKGNKIIEIFRKSNQIFGGFITGKIIDSAIIGVICYIGCMILRIPSALLVAVIVGVTNVVPVFGPFIGAIPSILIVLIQSPIHGLYLAIFILILQQVDGNIIGPKILGDTTGLSSFWVMFSILVAGGLFGFFGMLLGVPIFAVIYYLCQQGLKYRMEKRGLSNRTEDYVNVIAIDPTNKTMIYEVAEEEKVVEEK